MNIHKLTKLTPLQRKEIYLKHHRGMSGLTCWLGVSHLLSADL